MVIVTLASCANNEVKKTLEGDWRVTKLEANGKNIQDTLSNTLLSFGDDGKIDLPDFFFFDKGDYYNVRNDGYWKMEHTNGFQIVISSKQKIYEGEFSCVMNVLERNDLLLLELKSEGVKIICERTRVMESPNFQHVIDICRKTGGDFYPSKDKFPFHDSSRKKFE